MTNEADLQRVNAQFRTELGLGICQQIIDRYSATSRLERTLGSGPTVTIDLL
jgi:hypothetical protein